EVLQQGNVPVRERADFSPEGANITEKSVIIAQRQKEERAHSGLLGSTRCNLTRFDFDFSQIWDVNHAPAIDQHLETAGGAESSANAGIMRFSVASGCNGAEILTIERHQGPSRRTAEAVCLSQDGIEHRHKVAWRPIDDLQHFGGRCLPL